jgi:hypothetical protein
LFLVGCLSASALAIPPDTDGDGIPDWEDNCPGLANPNQTDTDIGTFGPRNIGLVISTEAFGANCVDVADLDGDGDVDILSASHDDDKIAWYENADGYGDFAGQSLISTEAQGARFVLAADLDRDWDLDVLSASYDDDKIVWYENVTGLGHFLNHTVITAAADGAMSVHAADLDGDDDLDVLSASYDDDRIAWYENLDGYGSFGGQRTISLAADGATSVYAADLDGDGDLDVLSTSELDGKIAWYRNTNGAGVFAAQSVITSEAALVGPVRAADLDGDGDLDVLTGAFWCENLDGAGGFGAPQMISGYGETRFVDAADLDEDGDVDVIVARGDAIHWHENMNGAGMFMTRTVTRRLRQLS